jgi:hypothetical protein
MHFRTITVLQCKLQSACLPQIVVVLAVLQPRPSPFAVSSQMVTSTQFNDDRRRRGCKSRKPAAACPEFGRSSQVLTPNLSYLMTALIQGYAIQARAPTPLNRSPVLLCQLHPLPPPDTTRASNSSSTKPALHCCFESEHLEDLQQLPALSVDTAAVQFEDHIHARRRDTIHRGPRRFGRDALAHNPYPGSWVFGMQEIHQPRRSHTILG